MAIDRINAFASMAAENHPSGYAVMDSGGKDSDVIKQIAFLSGAKFEIIHSHTTADHPLTVRYVRKEQKRWQALGISYTIVYPTYRGKRTCLWDLVALKGAPTRIRRWCCEILKEQTAGAGRYTVTGVRWAESVRRKQNRATYEVPSNSKERIKLNNDNDAKRRMTEHCMKKGQFVLNPIIDWQDNDIWEFHERYNLPHNPLYDLGLKRVGCVGCPMGRQKEELEKLPKYKALYIRSFQRYLNSRPDITEKFGWNSGQDMYEWWISQKPLPAYDDAQLSLDDDEDED